MTLVQMNASNSAAILLMLSDNPSTFNLYSEFIREQVRQLLAKTLSWKKQNTVFAVVLNSWTIKDYDEDYNSISIDEPFDSGLEGGHKGKLLNSWTLVDAQEPYHSKESNLIEESILGSDAMNKTDRQIEKAIASMVTERVSQAKLTKSRIRKIAHQLCAESNIDLLEVCTATGEGVAEVEWTNTGVRICSRQGGSSFGSKDGYPWAKWSYRADRSFIKPVEPEK